MKMLHFSRVGLLIALSLLMASPVLAVSTDNGSPLEGMFSLAKDAAITAQVLAKIALDKNVADVKIDVSTHNGTVILTGAVNSKFEANKLVELASSTAGTRNVDASKLTIKPSSQPATDIEITAKIKTLFLKEKLFGDQDIPVMSISVDTTNGIVYLTGSANTEQQVTNAETLAKSVTGVIEVKSNVNVVNKGF